MTLTQAGTYYLIRSGGNAFATQTYRFALDDVTNPATLTLGAKTSGTLTPGSQDAIYRFAGTAGQVVYLSSQTDSPGALTNTAIYSLYDSNGNLVDLSTDNFFLYNDFQATLPSTGNYTLVLAGGARSVASDTYSFILSTAAAPTAITTGQVVNGNIAGQTQRDEYTFTGTAGQVLYLDALGTSSSGLSLEIIEPDHEDIVSSDAGNDLGPFTLHESGTYTIAVYDSSANPGRHRPRIASRSRTSPTRT